MNAALLLLVLLGPSVLLALWPRPRRRRHEFSSVDEFRALQDLTR